MRRRRRHQDEAGPGQRLKWVWLVLTLTMSAATVPLLKHHHRPSIRISEKAKQPEGIAAVQSRPPEQRDIGRPVYPYSVIPGGIASVDELRSLLARDRIASAHFSNFDIR